MIDPADAIDKLNEYRDQLDAVPSANPAQEADKQALLSAIDDRIAICQRDLDIRQEYATNKALIDALENDPRTAAALEATKQRNAFIREIKKRYTQRPLPLATMTPTEQTRYLQLDEAAKRAALASKAAAKELADAKAEQQAIQADYDTLKADASALDGMAATPTDGVCQPCVEKAVTGYAAKQKRQAGGARVYPGQQQYGNCGIQSAGQMIAAKTGHPVNEDALLEESIAKKDADDVLFGRLRRKFFKEKSPEAGSTNYKNRASILKRHGVETDTKPMTAANLGDAIRDNKGVIAAVDAGVLWNDASALGGGHAIFVYDGDFDSSGQLTHVYLNDTGANNQGRKMPIADFLAAANARGVPGNSFNVSKDPLW